MNLKYNQDHWKWNEGVKLNEHYNHAKFDIYQIYSVRENRHVKVFALSSKNTNTDRYIHSHFSGKSKTPKENLTSLSLTAFWHALLCWFSHSKCNKLYTSLLEVSKMVESSVRLDKALRHSSSHLQPERFFEILNSHSTLQEEEVHHFFTDFHHIWWTDSCYYVWWLCVSAQLMQCCPS